MEENYKYVIKVCYNYRHQLLFFNEISVDIFLCACKKAFNIDFDKAIVQLSERDNAVIPKNKFVCTIERLANCACFQVNLQLMDDSAAIVTPHNLELHLISVGATHLLEQRNKTLSQKNRRELIRLVYAYQTARFGQDPKEEQKQSLALAVVFLFPPLKSSGKKGGTNIVRGYLDMKMRNARTAEKKRKMSISNSIANNESVLSVIDTADEESDVQFLKLAVVDKTIAPEFKAKLQATLSYRWEMMKTPELDLKETFPYFFTNPSVVLLDFALRYKEVDCNAFLDSWPEHSVRLNDILTNQYETNLYTMWSDEIRDLLILLKLLPAKAHGRNLLKIESFNKATEKLFVFRKSDVPIDKLIEPNNNHPYIIACGDCQKEISHYYIEVEKHIMNVPEDFDAAQTFDLFLKVHKVFNLNYDPNLQPMMKFVQNFIFRIVSRQFKVTTRMEELNNNLTNPMEQ